MLRLLIVKAPPVAVMVLKAPVEAVRLNTPVMEPVTVGLLSPGVGIKTPGLICPVPV